MKLIYLYIHDFHPFEKTELNFVSDFRCSLRSENELSVKYRKILPDHFFSRTGKDELHVSALIGANGSGKTSLVRFLEALFYPSQKVEFVALIEVRPKVLQPFYFFKKRELRLSLVKQGCGEFTIREPIRRNYARPDTRDEIRECFGIVYYSPHYSPSSILRSTGEQFIDLSTTGYLNAAASRAATMSAKSKEHVLADVLYRADELKRILRFTSSLERNTIFPLVSREKDPNAVPIPSGVVVRPAIWGRSEIVAGFNYRLSMASAAKVRNKRKSRWELSTGERSRLKGMILLLRQRHMSDCFFDVFLCFAAQYWDNAVSWSDLGQKKSDYGSALYDLCRKVDRLSPRDRQREILTFLKKSRPTMSGAVPYQIKGYDSDNTPYLFFSMLAGIKHDKLAFSEEWGSAGYYYATQGRDNVSIVSTMVDVYAASVAYGDYAVVDFNPPMSAGEYSFLVLFSRLYNYFEEIKRGVAAYDGTPVSRAFALPLNSGWLVILDEAEITLHPSWQRTIVNKILNNFERIFPGFEVHFIFASHSPILLSDIPIGNVVFLEGLGKCGKTRVGSFATREFKNTFGANIFDLYRCPYFLSEGTVGMFAQKKIDALIEKLRNLQAETADSEITEFSADDFRTLDLIGDVAVSRFLWRRCARIGNRGQGCNAED